MKIKLIFYSILFLSLCTEKLYAENAFDATFGEKASYQNAVVQSVVSADTIVIANETQKGETIKLIGLKALEHRKRKERSIERDQYGFEIKEEESPLTDAQEVAYLYVKDLLLGKQVSLEFDEYKKNESHQTLAYVFLKENNLFVNEEILTQGCAQLQIQPPNTKYAEKLRSAYKQAKSEQKGIHGE